MLGHISTGWPQVSSLTELKLFFSTSSIINFLVQNPNDHFDGLPLDWILGYMFVVHLYLTRVMVMLVTRSQSEIFFYSDILNERDVKKTR